MDDKAEPGNNYRSRLVAHRGYQQKYPENTLLGYQQAIAAGALSIETDVLLSADKHPLLYHDPTLKRVSGCKGRVDSTTLAELIRTPAYEPRRLGQRFSEQYITPLSDLVELLKEHPQVTAYIEVKKEAVGFAGTSDTYKFVSQCLAPVASQCIIISFDHDFMLFVRGQGWARCGVAIKRWKDLRSAKIAAIKPDTVFTHYRRIPAKADLKQLGFELVVYEIDEPALARKWLARGASKVETFDIGGLIAHQNL
ncbi:MAG: glycerophosphodiester phosphodiesterase [Gammaproteobacteria bacterium]|nr:glycerophosphodiester phosphodiesterase [Gammaproteobacteria bacterium]MBQ0838626.1 glycerophosphodiester phosphodiesterase [Gammaproteobacteria bacterium]